MESVTTREEHQGAVPTVDGMDYSASITLFSKYYPKLRSTTISSMKLFVKLVFGTVITIPALNFHWNINN
jgi:hypothetical protein